MLIEFSDRARIRAKRVWTAYSAAALSLAVSLFLGACSTDPGAIEPSGSTDAGPGSRTDGMISKDIDSVFQNRTDTESLSLPGGLDDPFSHGAAAGGLQ